ncbi:MAG TPA: nicotinamide-nucleotide amidohydrolase family protein [Chitinophagaceae bacterium]|nr:nicotinamide-nucleotide amidohydrolase family protein [Chitinophagaceae bacterium]HPH30316.1 nicotinamide-nucleotide amidohydrolase family protein [Chitinophagaceae bacterium]HPN59637.1 nicotinamide-nucleotide amidohydrolase family protein [Chitinophagaceae bacterium]
MSAATINASIITIGDELLIGQTIDTNSAFIAQELNKIGVWVRRRVAVGDVFEDIWKALDEEGAASDIVIITGGLGPTADDITKPLLCQYFGGRLVVNEEVKAHVKNLFENVYRRPGALLERNLKQAEVPDVCTVLHNARGTAPGMMFYKPRVVAPLNPPKEGNSASQRQKMNYEYRTANTDAYTRLKEFVEENRGNQTPAEEKLWAILRGKKIGGYKFRRQHIIGNYIADFICLNENLIIEVDGNIHQLPENQANDESRTKDLNILGYKVIRFTNDEVLFNSDHVISSILSALKKENIELPESQSPPLGGGGASTIFISLPGVPHEMKGLITDQVIPRLMKEFTMPVIIHRTAFTAGQGESMLAEMLMDFEASLPDSVKMAYLPNYGMVKLRLTAKGITREEVETILNPVFDRLLEEVKNFLVTDTDEGLEVVVGKILKAKGLTLGTAESCTGGHIAQLITSVPGSSAYFKGGIVSYANEVKTGVLGVAPETLQSAGAVSEETVRQMVQGAIRVLEVDYAVAVSGIMGPDGGSPEKPVGTVWIAVGNKEKTDAIRLNLRFDRQRNIGLAAVNALNYLRKFILTNS